VPLQEIYSEALPTPARLLTCISGKSYLCRLIRNRTDNRFVQLPEEICKFLASKHQDERTLCTVLQGYPPL